MVECPSEGPHETPLDRIASLDELRACIDVLGKKLLPNTLKLAQQRGGDPDEHWLRKMPE